MIFRNKQILTSVYNNVVYSSVVPAGPEFLKYVDTSGF